MSDISSIKLPDNSNYDIKAKKIFYAECSTARNVAAKAVTCDGFVLEAGAVIAIRFTDTTTVNPSSGNITLNINRTGAKNIVPKGNNSVYNYGWGWAFCNNQTWLFLYNGTYFVCLNQDNNSDTKVTNTLNTTAKAYITGTTSAATNTGTQVFDTGVYLDTTAGVLTAATFKGALSGNASSATKLNDSAGSATQPVYFSGGKPVATTYSLGKSVPSNAVFTDTWRGIQNNLNSDSTSDSLSAAQGKALKALIDGKAAASHSHTISQISDFPASLPANGGNADTVDGLHANDFTQIIDFGYTVTDTKTAIGQSGKTTIYRCASWTDIPIGVLDGQGSIITINYNNTGTAGTDSIWCTQIFISAHGPVFIRAISDVYVGSWIEILTSGSKPYQTGVFTLSGNESKIITLGFTPSYVDVRGDATGYRINVEARITTNGFTAIGLELTQNAAVRYIAFR